MFQDVLFYGQVVPLNRHLHRDALLNVQENRFGFARGSHVIPALVDEMLSGGRHMPIVFLPGIKSPSPVFLVGLRANYSALVNADGSWRADYVPAFLRRYPFMLGEIAGQESVACIDEAGLAISEGEGERLFADDGTDTPFLQQHVRFMTDYYAAAKRNDLFVKRLENLALFRSVTIDAKFDAGGVASLHGFLTIDGDKLAALSGDEFLALRDDGFLPAIYGHLASLGMIDAIRLQMDRATVEDAARAAPVPVATPADLYPTSV